MRTRIKYYFSLNREILWAGGCLKTTLANIRGRSSTNKAHTPSRSLTRAADPAHVFLFQLFLAAWCVFWLAYYVAFEWSTGFVLFSISSHSHCFIGIFWSLLCTHTTETMPTADTGMYGKIQLCTTVTSTVGAPMHMPAPTANYQYTNALLHTHSKKKRHIDEKRTNTHNPKKNTNASVKMIKSRADSHFRSAAWSMVVHRMGPCSRMIRFVRRINFQRFDYRESSSSVAMRKLSRNLWRRVCRHVFSRSPMSMPQFHVEMWNEK